MFSSNNTLSNKIGKLLHHIFFKVLYVYSMHLKLQKNVKPLKFLGSHRKYFL